MKWKQGGVVSFVAATALLGASSSASAATVTVTPNSNLPATSNVQVSGTGYAAAQPGTIHQCTADLITCSISLASFQTTASGNFGPTPITVRRTFTGEDPPNPVIDCGLQSCVVFASLNNIFSQGSQAITFASTTPPPGGGGGGGGGSTTAPATSPTGERAAALKKCAKIKKKAKKKKCKKRARALPV